MMTYEHLNSVPQFGTTILPHYKITQYKRDNKDN